MLLNQFRVILLSIFLTIMGLFGAQSVLASPKYCMDLLATPYGQMKPSFLKKHSTKYTKVILRPGEIKNQCQMGTCHLHSWLSSLEQHYHQKKREPILLSNHYLVSQHLLETAFQVLRNQKKDDYEISLGAGPEQSFKLVSRYGVIPDVAWTGRRDFMVDANAKKLMAAIDRIIAHTKMKLEVVDLSPEQRELLYQQAEQAIRSQVQLATQYSPNDFIWNDQSMNAKTFFQENFSDFISNLKIVKINFTKDDFSHADLVEKMIIKRLDKNLPVYLSYKHDGTFVDETNGIMSIQAYPQDPLTRPLTRKQREKLEIAEGAKSLLQGGGHAVQIVGYDIDPKTQQIIKFKIKNSWGEARGDQGYFHMYRDYFRAFTHKVTFQHQF